MSQPHTKNSPGYSAPKPFGKQNLYVKRTDRATDRIQWIRLEEIGKTFIDKTRAVRKLNTRKRRTQTTARDGITAKYSSVASVSIDPE